MSAKEWTISLSRMSMQQRRFRELRIAGRSDEDGLDVPRRVAAIARHLKDRPVDQISQHADLGVLARRRAYSKARRVFSGPRHQPGSGAVAHQPNHRHDGGSNGVLDTDGTIPKDNPFVATPGERPEIYALGFRDPQGMAIHPKTGRLWTSEHGPRGGDEINEVGKGKNYGFPVIGYGRDYNGKPINGDKTVQAGLEQPVYYWTPDIAPAGIAFYTGRMFPVWNGNLFVSSLLGRYLVRLVLDGSRVVAEERLLADLSARIRGVHEGPDGSLYVLTDGANGKILRLVRKG